MFLTWFEDLGWYRDRATVASRTRHFSAKQLRLNKLECEQARVIHTTYLLLFPAFLCQKKNSLLEYSSQNPLETGLQADNEAGKSFL